MVIVRLVWSLTLPFHAMFLGHCFPSRFPHKILRDSTIRSRTNKLISFTNFNAQFFYSITICMLYYNPRHVSSINMHIFRRTNCIITASGNVALCKPLCSMPDESRLLSSGILYYTVQRVTIPVAVIIQFVLLKMLLLMLETCRGL
jgi:hypothetical protein